MGITTQALNYQEFQIAAKLHLNKSPLNQDTDVSDADWLITNFYFLHWKPLWQFLKCVKIAFSSTSLTSKRCSCRWKPKHNSIKIFHFNKSKPWEYWSKSINKREITFWFYIIICKKKFQGSFISVCLKYILNKWSPVRKSWEIWAVQPGKKSSRGTFEQHSST